MLKQRERSGYDCGNAEAGNRGDHGERPIAEPSRNRQDAGPSQHACRKKDFHQSGIPRATAKMPQGHYWEQCRERRERESEDEPAPKKGEQPPVPPPNQLVAARNLREEPRTLLGKGKLRSASSRPPASICAAKTAKEAKSAPSTSRTIIAVMPATE